MKKLYLFFLITLASLLSAQNGAVISGLVKINGIQENNTNKVLLTDGNGNLGYTTLTNLSNVGTVVNTVLNTAVGKTQVANPAVFRNLPNYTTNRIVTLDTKGSLGYRTLNSSANGAAITGTIGLNATNLINLGTAIFNAPTTYSYIVTVDNNGVLGKMPLSALTVKDPTKPCSPTGIVNYGPWGPWYNGGCYADRTVSTQYQCTALNGSAIFEYQTTTETRTDGCDIVSCSGWTNTGVYGAWSCASAWNQIRDVQQSRTCTRVNGTSYVDTQTTTELKTNLPPTGTFNWSANHRTINFSAVASDPDGTIASVTWDFGDGTTATGLNVSHTYANSDPTQAVTKNVQMTITDNCGRQTSVNQPVTTSYIQKTAIVSASTYFQRAEGYNAANIATAYAGQVISLNGQTANFNVTTVLENYNGFNGANNAYIQTSSNFYFTIDGLTSTIGTAYSLQGSPSVGTNGPAYYDHAFNIPYQIIGNMYNFNRSVTVTSATNGAVTGYIVVYGNGAWVANEMDPLPKTVQGVDQVKIDARAPAGSGSAFAAGTLNASYNINVKYY